MEKTLTIIIPTYNMEKYLDRCLTSLIIEDKELMEQLEVLVIIDGATDRSSEIAHAYQDKYPDTYRVIDKENGNYGSCINRGLMEATGKYVKILDADDYFKNENLESYIRFLLSQDADMVLNQGVTVDEKNNISGQLKMTGLAPGKTVCFDEFAKKSNFLMMHDIAYKAKCLKDINYKQTEGISYTDQEWDTFPISAINTVILWDEVLYCYLVGRDGQTMDKDILSKKFSDQVRVAINIMKWAEGYNGDLIHKKYLMNRCFAFTLHLYSEHIVNGLFSEEEFKKFDLYIKENHAKLYTKLGTIIYPESCGYKYISKWRESGLIGIPQKIKDQANNRSLIFKVYRKVMNFIR